MARTKSDALVVFGVTGDLAHKQIIPALYAMVKRGELTSPVVGVAFENWSMEKLQKRIRESIERAGGVDDKSALKTLLSRFTYVSGDYKDRGVRLRRSSRLWVGQSGQRIIWRFRHRCLRR